jgi:hypothetical protein
MLMIRSGRTSGGRTGTLHADAGGINEPKVHLHYARPLDRHFTSTRAEERV